MGYDNENNIDDKIILSDGWVLKNAHMPANTNCHANIVSECGFRKCLCGGSSIEDLNSNIAEFISKDKELKSGVWYPSTTERLYHNDHLIKASFVGVMLVSVNSFTHKIWTDDDYRDYNDCEWMMIPNIESDAWYKVK